MSDCAALIAQAGSGVAPTLQAVDCMTASAGASSFGHLLGSQGALAPVLTAALTIYVAAYGFALITGRVRLGLGGLSGRMLALGAVLAFATSWAVYGPLVYNLATRGPDQVAGALLGSRGSATATFAQRIDTVFAAVGEATQQAAQAEAERAAQTAAAQQQSPGNAPVAVPQPRTTNSANAGFSPATIAQGAAIVLLLSTVGVLVTARIVLAALLLIGPIFVVMALFGPARGLFAGWLHTLALAAFAPMLVVLGGAFTLELAVPTVTRLLGPDGIDQNAATGFFLIATVHAALMTMALRAAASMVAGWKPWGRNVPAGFAEAQRDAYASMVIASPAGERPRTTTVIAGPTTLDRSASNSRISSASMMTTRETRSGGVMSTGDSTGQTPRRAVGIGSRFRPANTRVVMK